jgi:hypothetical protein
MLYMHCTVETNRQTRLMCTTQHVYMLTKLSFEEIAQEHDIFNHAPYLCGRKGNVLLIANP